MTQSPQYPAQQYPPQGQQAGYPPVPPQPQQYPPQQYPPQGQQGYPQAPQAQQGGYPAQQPHPGPAGQPGYPAQQPAQQVYAPAWAQAAMADIAQGKLPYFNDVGEIGQVAPTAKMPTGFAITPGNNGKSSLQVNLRVKRAYVANGQKRTKGFSIRVVMWGARITTIAGQLRVGTLLAVRGELGFNNFQDAQTGQQVRMPQIAINDRNADGITIIGWQDFVEDRQQPGQQPYQVHQGQPGYPPQGGQAPVQYPPQQYPAQGQQYPPQGQQGYPVPQGQPAPQQGYPQAPQGQQPGYPTAPPQQYPAQGQQGYPQPPQGQQGGYPTQPPAPPAPPAAPQPVPQATPQQYPPQQYPGQAQQGYPQPPQQYPVQGQQGGYPHPQ